MLFRSNTIKTTLTGNTSDLKLILGLVQHNFSFSKQVYNEDKNLISGEIKLYNSASDCTADLKSIASYGITASYDADGLLIDYNVISTDILGDELDNEFADENADTFILA